MLREIYEYGKAQFGADAKIGVSRKGTIRVYFLLDEVGNYQGLELIEDKNVRNNAVIPNVGNWASNTSKDVPLVNGICKVIPGWDGKNKKGHENWLYYMDDAQKKVSGLEPVWTFVKHLECDAGFCEKIKQELSSKVKESDNVSFKVDGKYILDYLDWEPYIKNLIKKEDTSSKKDAYVSSITGEVFEGATTIGILQSESNDDTQGFKKANTGSGVYIASYNQESFNHYLVNDSNKCENMHVSQNEADLINKTLKYLISSPEHYFNDFNLVYWYNESVPDLIRESLNLKEQNFDDDFSDASIEKSEATDLMKRLLHSATNGDKLEIEHYSARYTMFNFEIPSKGRCLLYNMQVSEYDDLAQNLFEWYRDSLLVFSRDGKQYQKPLINIYRILILLLDHEDASKQFEQIDKEFGRRKNNLLASVYKNKQINDIFIKKAVDKVGRKKTSQNPIPRELIQLMKIYLTRKKEDSIMIDKTLNQECPSVAYQLGRYFAVCEKLQNDESNATTIGTLFGGIQNSPRKIYPKLVKMGKVYINKLNTEGSKIFYKSLLSDIGARLGNLPASLNLTQKCEFILGYYQQNNELYKKKETKEEI